MTQDKPPAEEIERQAEEVASRSPEGRPHDPTVGAKQIGMMVVMLIVLVFVVALLITAFVSVPVGIALGGLGLLIFICNPVVWASFLRAKERKPVRD